MMSGATASPLLQPDDAVTVAAPEEMTGEDVARGELVPAGTTRDDSQEDEDGLPRSSVSRQGFIECRRSS